MNCNNMYISESRIIYLNAKEKEGTLVLFGVFIFGKCVMID